MVLPDTASDNLREKQQGVPKSFGIGDRGGMNPPVVFTVKYNAKLTKPIPLGLGSSLIAIRNINFCDKYARRNRKVKRKK